MENMQNVKENQLKKCIVMSFDELRGILIKMYGDPDVNDGPDIAFSEDGVYYHNLDWREFYLDLSKHFKVMIKSMHTDSWNENQVWICYEEFE